MKITKGKATRPRRVLLYGQHGVGKSSWANAAPRPIFLNIEDGLADIDCEATDLLRSIGDVSAALSWLNSNPHDYQSVVMDSVDWFENLLMKAVAVEFGVQTYEEIEFGKGKGRVISGWQWIINSLESLRRGKGMNIILLSHSRIEKFSDPSGAAYDRYVPDLHKISFGLVQEWVDEVFFARFRTLTTEMKEDFGKKRAVAVGGKERLILTSESAASMAKNRLQGLPDELPMNWPAYQGYWPKGRQEVVSVAEPIPEVAVAPVGNIEGVVVNGSSKTSA